MYSRNGGYRCHLRMLMLKLWILFPVEWAMHDNPYPKEQIVENSTRADLRWELRWLAERKCAVWGFVMLSSWFVSVVLEYTKPRLARTSVLDEQRNPLVSRLIGGGICHWLFQMSQRTIGHYPFLLKFNRREGIHQPPLTYDTQITVSQCPLLDLSVTW